MENRHLLVSRAPASVGSKITHWSLGDWTHLTHSHSDLTPQFESAHVDIDRESLTSLRWILRDVDAVLCCNGRLTIAADAPIATIIKTELFRLFGHRYLLDDTDGAGTLGGVKREMLFATPITNESWTVAVMSGGNNDHRLKRIIESIGQNGFAQVELLIVGPAPGFELPKNVRHIDFPENFADCRFPICDKKNLVAECAATENLLIIHDRIYLSADWYKKICAFRKDWQLLSFPSAPAGTKDTRLADWTVADNSGYEQIAQARLSTYFRCYPFNYSDLRHSNLPYDQCSPMPVLNGACFAIRRSVLKANPLPKWLHWAEIEDGHWSMALFNAGITVSLSPDSVILAENEGRYQSKSSRVPQLLMKPLGTLRLKARRTGYMFIQSVLDRMNQEQDIFSRKGVFSKSIVSLDSPLPDQIAAIDWGKYEGALIRGGLERTRDIRTLLNTIRASTPIRKKIYLELATCGFRFFKRSEHVRNAESLLYEAACCFRNDFILEHIFCSRQHNFLLQFNRIASGPIRPLESILVYHVARAFDPLLFAEAFPRSEIALSSEDTIAMSSLSGYEAVLILGRETSVDELKRLIEPYTATGFATMSQGGSMVLEDVTLIESQLLATVSNGLQLSKSNALKEIVEYNLILQGYSCLTNPNNRNA